MSEQELLPLGPEASTASSLCEVFTTPLRSFLLNASNAKDAVAHATPMMRAECARVASVVARLAAPVGHDNVYRALEPCIVLWGAPDFGEATGRLQQVWTATYAEALHLLPREALELAVSEWIAFGKPYFPKPSELNKLAAKRAEEARLLAWRCKAVADAAAAAAEPEISADERATVKAQLDQLAAELGARRYIDPAERAASRMREPSHA